MLEIGSAMTLTGSMSIYYNLRVVWSVAAVFLLGITIFYGYKVHIGKILSKKTGIYQRKEMALMREGKAVKRNRKRNGNETYTQQMMMGQTETTVHTSKLNETRLLEENDATTILVQNEEQKQFYLIKNIIVVHGKPVPKLKKN